MKPIPVSSHLVKAAHFDELAGRAAYNAAVSVAAWERDQWAERASRYDESAATYREYARRAA